MKINFDKLDQKIHKILLENVGIMPIRLCKLIADSYTDARIRKIYLKRLGVHMGEHTFSNIGLRVVPNDNEICVLIGDHVSLAPNITFVCNSSANNGLELPQLPYVRDFVTKAANIIVEDDVWIGANVTILPGVQVGRCSIIGAGSVVTGNVEAYSIYAGIPAKKIRDLSNGEKVI